MKKDAEVVALCHLFNYRHEQEVMVVGKIALLEYRREFKLIGSHLVMTGLRRYAEFVAFCLEIEHECLHSTRYRAEIMIFELLVLCRLMTHEGSSGHHKVRTGGKQCLVYKEVFLLPAEICLHMIYRRIEITCHSRGGFVHAVERAKQRCLVVKALSGIRDKHRGNTEGIVDDKRRRRYVPRRITARLEGVADSAIRKT